MGFRLVPKSVTLNKVERRNGRYMAYYCYAVSFSSEMKWN